VACPAAQGVEAGDVLSPAGGSRGEARVALVAPAHLELAGGTFPDQPEMRVAHETIYPSLPFERGTEDRL